jgi:hypothetical protein
MKTNLNTTTSATAGDTAGAPTSALEVIRELASQGHTSRYIARALQLRHVPTFSGRGEWHAKTVWKLMQKHGISTSSARVW